MLKATFDYAEHNHKMHAVEIMETSTTYAISSETLPMHRLKKWTRERYPYATLIFFPTHIIVEKECQVDISPDEFRKLVEQDPNLHKKER